MGLRLMLSFGLVPRRYLSKWHVWRSAAWLWRLSGYVPSTGELFFFCVQPLVKRYL